jgi:hypothetical protein
MDSLLSMDVFLNLCGIVALGGAALGFLLPTAYPERFDTLRKKEASEPQKPPQPK